MSRQDLPEGIVIREIVDIPGMRRVESLQKEIWGFTDLDVVPMNQLKASVTAGAILLGAYDRGEMIGFVYGFVGLEDGHTIIHSHMMAVKPEYRNSQVGYRLKLAQRESALEKGIRRMTWTFDPLQSRNAYFNFAKLGVICDKYLVDFYGEETSSPLHQGGTDRFLVTWRLDDPGVIEKISQTAGAMPEADEAGIILRIEPDERPGALREIPSAPDCPWEIEIPRDLLALCERWPEAPAVWRLATRDAFLAALQHGYIVTGFHRRKRAGLEFGAYRMTRQTATGAESRG